MAGGAIPFSLMLLMRVAGIVVLMLVLVWILHFRGGMALGSHDLDLIRNAHPLMLIGFILLSGEAMLVYKTAFGTRKHMNALHLVLQATAFVLGITGIWAAFKFHSDKGFRGFYSLHSWLGLACVLFFGIQWLVGLASFWYPGIGRINRPKVFPWYAFLGLYNYGLAVAAAETGFVERLTFLQASKIITRYSLEALVVNILGLVLVLLSGCVYLCTITPITNKDHVYRTL